MDYKIILSGLGIGVAILSYVLYFRDIAQGKTKPHAFSWFVWSILEIIGFGVLLSAQAGPGAWITGCSALFTFTIAMIGLKQKVQQYTITDWIALTLALLAIILWWLTKQPAIAIILVATADTLGFIPTFRKSYHQPWQESISMYALSALKYVFALLALDQYAFTTVFYQGILVCMNSAFITLSIIRRKQLKK